MKLTIQILTILILFTQCVKEELIKPKERIGVYGAGIGVKAPTNLIYPDFEVHIEKYSDYYIRNIIPPHSLASVKIIHNNINQEFKLGLFVNRPEILQKSDHIKEVIIDNILFRITFETFNWDTDKSTDEVLIVDKGRFLVEKVE